MLNRVVFTQTTKRHVEAEAGLKLAITLLEQAKFNLAPIQCADSEREMWRNCIQQLTQAEEAINRVRGTVQNHTPVPERG